MPDLRDHTRRDPRDGDGDGRIGDGTPEERAAAPPQPPPRAPQQAAPAAQAPPAVPAVTLRGATDAVAARAAIYDKALAAAANIRPVTNAQHILSVVEPAYEGATDFTPADEKRAVLQGGTLGRRLRATWLLTDAATGETLSERRTTLATIPYMTERGTFIHNGTEYSLATQLRLRPGIYARRKSNGQMESHVNVSPGTGVSSRLELEPETGRFRIGIAQSHMPLTPLLRALGITTARLREAWGSDVAAANLLKDDPSVVDKLHARLIRARPGSPPGDAESRREAVAAAFRGMPLDPEVNRRTLGAPHASVDGEALLAATAKLLAIHRGEARPDDRDHLAYMTAHPPEDLIAERVGRDRMGMGRLLWKSSRLRSVDHIPAGAMTKSVQSAILGSGLGQPTESISMAMLLDQRGRVSRLGVGGIPSTDSIPEESRSVQPSQLGYVDFVVTPESLAAGVDGRLASGTAIGSDGQLYARFRDARSGRTSWLTPRQLADKVVALPGELASGRPHVTAVADSRTGTFARGDVDYELTDMEAGLSPLSNMVPMKSAAPPHRASMAGRFMAQSLPLRDPEAPVVRAGMVAGGSYESAYGAALGAPRAGGPGRVAKVTADEIVIRRDDRTVERHALHQHMPFNRKTQYHQTPAIAPGARVLPGTLLATSNYTDGQGVAALGKNARVAYLPNGANFEDAVVVSRAFADRMRSEHTYQHELEHGANGVRPGRDVFASVFPGRVDHGRLRDYDERGVARPGTVLHHGDPVILAVKERQRNHNTLHKGRGASYADASITWDHHDDGVVQDVAGTSRGILATVRTSAGLEVGDKLAARSGAKGVIAQIIDDGDMPHGEDGRPFEILYNPLGVISRKNPNQMVEAALGKVAAATGRHYDVPDFANVDDLLKYAEDELAKHGLADTETVTDPKTGRKIPGVSTGVGYVLKLHHTSESKNQGRGTGAYAADGTPAKGGPTGCFAAKQPIATIDGPVDIARICEKRLGVQVRTFSRETGEWTYRPVIDWFTYRAKVGELVNVETSDGSCMLVTKNHEVFVPALAARASDRVDEYEVGDWAKRQVGELAAGDSLLTWGTVPSEVQWSFMYGSLLGDASATAAAFTCEHSIKQQEYVAWKQSLLSGLGAIVYDRRERAKPSVIRGEAVRSSASKIVSVGARHIHERLRRDCYGGPGETKTVTEAWLRKVGDIGIAAWVLDDGSITNRSKKKGKVAHTGNIATHGFDAGSRQLLADWLRDRLGAPCSVNCVGAINLSAEACGKLVELIAAWVPGDVIPGSKQFLKAAVLAIQSRKPPKDYRHTSHLGLVPLRIKGIKPYVHDKPDVDEINVYDFTVADTHSYCAGTAWVSNSKRLSLMDVNALLSHGASAIIRDAGLHRGQAQPEYWAQVMAGFDPPSPRTPAVYEAFMAKLSAAGIHPMARGTKTQLMALTDSDVDHLAGGRNLENAETVDWRDLQRPVKGGLMDQTLTGGPAGNRWSAIRLHEPMPNPVMEDPVRHTLGLTRQGFRDVLAGRSHLKGSTGPSAIADALRAIDLPKEVAAARLEVKSAKGGARDAAVRRLGYLAAAERMGLHPGDWVLKRMPVLPPAFRPVSLMQGSKLPLVADPNVLYRELHDANANLAALSGRVDDVGEEREAVYDAMKGVVGLGEPIHPKNRERAVKGILKHMFGDSPKYSTVQRKLVSSTTDMVGRGVIAPDPDLDMDQVGIPEARAWDVYKPFMIRRLVRRGMPRMRAARAVEERSPEARQALLDEMDSRPVILNRAPTLHRYSVMAFRPTLVRGDTLKLPTLVYKGYGADNDGDQQYDHVICRIDVDRREALVLQYDCDSKTLGDHLVPAHFKDQVSAVVDGDVYLFHLEDFPHGKLLKTTPGQFGPVDWYEVPAGVRVLAQGDDGQLRWSPATIWSKHHDCEVQVVHLASGRSIYTDDDPRAVFGVPAGSLEFARDTPRQATERRFLVPRMARLADHPLACDEGEVLVAVSTVAYAGAASRCRLKPEVAVDGGLGYLIGCVVGDGWATSNERDLCVAGITWPIIDKLDGIMPTLFDGPSPRRCTVESEASYGESRRHTYASTELAKFMAALVGRRSAYKRLPAWFLRTSKAFREGLLAGLMDTDGTVAIGRFKTAPQLIVNYTSASLRLCQEVRLLAATLGIRGRVNASKTPAGKPHWVLNLSNFDFHAWGGAEMQHPGKLANMAEVPVGITPALVRHDLIPISTELAKACRSAIGMPKLKSRRRPGQVAVYGAFHDAITNGYLTRHSACRLCEFVDGDALALVPGWDVWQAIVANTDVTWDPVASWEAAGMTLTGYDLTVPGAETFVNADGVVLSNTMQYHVPASDEAAAEAYAKMLPSKNLFAVADFKAHQLPTQEYVAGLFAASAAGRPGARAHVMQSAAHVAAAHARGELALGDSVLIPDDD